ncbi:flagellar biosynthetic protein FliO [Blastomonas marina]|uniref:Flagellar biogenesis protein n=1 Tax=Blastomonas marina TaxID=1867408 RepID=A0ABQ1F1D8_9SPHN|nr:flagellar biosynthetic protein FliO [Blastomonas marina]WPZ03614.1 flagellar biosynthetic protein FliO [Blastomonas marina]GFZ96316.1 hypothetical protein GCM10010923_00130 [Blastomonas marina]
MTYYILKLVIMLPLMAAMIVGSLWVYRKYQPGFAGATRQRNLRLVETLSLGSSGKLAVIDFGEQRLLVSAVRGRIECLSTQDRPDDADLVDELDRDGGGDPTVDLPAKAKGFRAALDRALNAPETLRQMRTRDQ